MPFDERLVLNKENKANIIYDEHLVRYRLAAQAAAGKKILDIACGSGYGSKILAEAGAAKVTAVDKSPEAVAMAKQDYHAANLEFKAGDAENIAEADKSFDLVVSFETIEHLNNAEKYLAEIARVLNAQGFFLVSTPNREVFGQKNPYHLREFTRGEFEAVLKKYFKNIFILEQINGLASLIKAGNTGNILFSPPAGGASAKPLYFIAVCGNNNLPLADLFRESVVSVNPAALDRMRSNPAVRLIDNIYSLITKIPGMKKMFEIRNPKL
ncbi:MAG: class I SAM-dependent methyltransferase [Patescibacteria group bacterium]|nr:class I SAM-dependent methyltransferase [Patescibacteria group bacterium]